MVKKESEKRNVMFRRGRDRLKEKEIPSPPERPYCVISKTALGTGVPKVMITAYTDEIYASEDEFFNKFVFKVCQQKNARPHRKRWAAKDVPGLTEYKGSRGVRWRLSYNKMTESLPLRKLAVLLDLVDPRSPLHKYVVGADERNRHIAN